MTPRVNAYAYDANGLLSKVTDPSSGVFNLGYDPLGRLASLSRPNGASDTYAYDAAGQFSSRRSSKGSSVIDALSYTYDSSGRRTSKTDAAGTTAYGYDTADRLISVLAPAGSSLPNETFAYDAAGNQTGSGQHYDAANRLLSDATYDYAYDNEGNQTTKTERATGKLTTYAWNALHQLTSAHLPDGSTVTYRYDALGRRVEQSGSAGTTRYVNLGANVVAEYDGTNTLRASYLTTLGTGDLPGMPLEVTTGSTSSYPLVDGVGSVKGFTDASGSISSAFSYTAYGTPVGASSGTYAYGTYGYDSATGLYYARARYYDPGSGRFLSEDPVASINPYPYGAGSPTTDNDPLGEQATAQYIVVIANILGTALATAAHMTIWTGEHPGVPAEDEFRESLIMNSTMAVGTTLGVFGGVTVAGFAVVIFFSFMTTAEAMYYAELHGHPLSDQQKVNTFALTTVSIVLGAASIFVPPSLIFTFFSDAAHLQDTKW